MTRTTARRAGGGAAAVLLAATLSACAGPQGSASSPTPSPSAPSASASATPTPTASSPAAPPADEPTDGLAAFTAPGEELTAEGDASGYVVTAVRTGVHDGYARVVYELTGGQGTPGYRVGYVDAAVEDPSGEVRDVAGDAVLRVTVIGTTYPAPGGPQEHADDLTPGAGGIAQVSRPLTFEAMTESFVGLDGQRSFRVTVLADPVRVVVDLEG